MTCPGPALLARASIDDPAGDLDGARVAAVRAHAARCAGCAEVLADARALRALAAALPSPPLAPDRRASLTAAVLAHADAAGPGRGWRRWPIVAAVAAAMIAALVGARAFLSPRDSHPIRALALAVHASVPVPVPVPGSTPVITPLLPTIAAAPPRAIVVATGDARFDRPADDLVRIDHGTVTVDTNDGAPLRVVASNAALRPDRARFDASAHGGVVDRVAVFAGSVEIVSGGRTVVVQAGEIWIAPASPPPAPAPAPASRLDPGAAHFRAGWVALRDHDNARAASELDLARADDTVGEDATYWAAVAHQRAGDADLARVRFAELLAHFPRSPRAGDAHLALARLLRAIDPAAAVRHRDAAKADRDPRVRAAAEAMSLPAP